MNVKIALAFAVLGVLLFSGLWFFARANLPVCQTMSDAQYTGPQTVDGVRVECFKGQIIRVVR